MQKFFTFLMLEGQASSGVAASTCLFSPKSGWAQGRLDVSWQLAQTSV